MGTGISTIECIAIVAVDAQYSGFNLVVTCKPVALLIDGEVGKLARTLITEAIIKKVTIQRKRTSCMWSMEGLR